MILKGNIREMQWQSKRTRDLSVNMYVGRFVPQLCLTKFLAENKLFLHYCSDTTALVTAVYQFVKDILEETLIVIQCFKNDY